MYCKNCGKEIPRQAAFCPHCGAKNTPHANTQTTAAPTGTPPRRHRRWWLVVLSVLIVLAAGAVICRRAGDVPEGFHGIGEHGKQRGSGGNAAAG